MSEPRFDLTGIGNAIVDLLALTDDSFLARHNMPKGSMTLIDADTATRLTAEMPNGQTASGGSVANSCAVAAALGARVAFSAKSRPTRWAMPSAGISRHSACITRPRRCSRARPPRAA